MQSGEYEDVQCVAYLNWKSLPEAAKQVKALVVPDGRVTEYLHGNTRIVNVQPYGYFQII